MERTQPPAHFSQFGSGGTKDGDGAGDHDQPYQFGIRPRAISPWPFSERQYGRLLVLRGRVQDLDFATDHGNEHPIAFLPDGVWVASTPDLLDQPRAV